MPGQARGILRWQLLLPRIARPFIDLTSAEPAAQFTLALTEFDGRASRACARSP